MRNMVGISTRTSITRMYSQGSLKAITSPHKFGFDTRKNVLSNEILAGTITREEALKRLEQPPYDPDLMAQDKEYIAKKLGVSTEEFEAIIEGPKKTPADYKNSMWMIRLGVAVSKITNIDQIRKLLAIGYEKVVINTALIDNPDLIKQAAELFGSQSVVASIDAKKIATSYEVYVEDGTRKAGITPAELARKALELGVGEIIINSMDNDGMMQGYDIDMVKEIADAVDIPVTAIGGAGGIHDLKKVLTEGHAHAAAGGSMFVFYGRLRAVLITAPREEELVREGIYSEI